MSITVRELLQLPHLRLTLTAGQGGLDHQVSWVHSSDLPDPTGGALELAQLSAVQERQWRLDADLLGQLLDRRMDPRVAGPLIADAGLDLAVSVPCCATIAHGSWPPRNCTSTSRRWATGYGRSSSSPPAA
jgi:hypothetical protein